MDAFIIPPLISLALAVALILALDEPARELGLVDRPGGRKKHAEPVPLIGGLAVVIAFAGGVLLVDGPLRDHAALFAGLGLLLITGLVDDAQDMRSTTKLMLQFVAAALVVGWGGLVITDLGVFVPGERLELSAWAIPLTLFALVGFINALNMMDGADGLAGGVSLAMLGWLVVAATLSGLPVTTAVAATLAAAVAGFLLFNMRHPGRPRAAVFLGDAGSMALGLGIAWLALEVLTAPGRAVSPAGIAWVLALPAVDTLSLMIRRMLKGQSPFRADREHLHHIFLRAGYTVGETSALLLFLTVLLGGIGVMGSVIGVPDPILYAGLLALVAGHVVFIRRAWRTARALRRLHQWSGSAPMTWPVRCADGVETRCAVPPVTGWRRWLALGGLYLLVFSLPFHETGLEVGFAALVVATLASLPTFLADLRRLPVAWLALGLSVYITLRGEVFGETGQLVWSEYLWVSGLAALPVGWWLAGARWHWLPLFLVLVAGWSAAFALQADWAALMAGRLADPLEWGSPAVIGSLAALLAVALLGAMLSAFQRLGCGWRPAAMLAVFGGVAVTALVVLAGTGYTIAWLAALAGVLTMAAAAVVYGLNRRHWVGLVGGSLLAVGVVTATWSVVDGAGAGAAGEGVDPVAAAELHFDGEQAAAAELYPAVAQRLAIWEKTVEAVARAPWLGPEEAGAFTEPAEYAHLQSAFGSIALDFGLVGLALFGLLVGLLVRDAILLARHRLWAAVWVVAILGVSASLGALLLLSVQVHATPGRALVALVAAVYFAGAFQRRWFEGGRGRRAGPGGEELPAGVARITTWRDAA
ncbi:MAG: hypothetical protein ACLFTX_06870 [Thiohalospira sp.]